MSKFALAARNLEAISNLIQGKVDTIEVLMVPRDVCEVVENGFEQIIPYYVIFGVNDTYANVVALKYSRPSKGEGEERLQGKHSIGFGGHIESADMGEHAVTVSPEGWDTYVLTVEELVTIIDGVALREIKEEIGVDLEGTQEFLTAVNSGMSINKCERPGDVNFVHVSFTRYIQVSLERLSEIKESAVAAELEIENLSYLTISTGELIATFDTTAETLKLAKEVEADFEDWSVDALVDLVKSVTHSVVSRLTFDDIYQALVRKATAQLAEAVQEEQPVVEEQQVEVATDEAPKA